MYTESKDKNGNLHKHQLTHKSLVQLIGYTKNYPFWTRVDVDIGERTVKLYGKIHTVDIIFKTDSVFKQYIEVLEEHFNVKILE